MKTFKSLVFCLVSTVLALVFVSCDKYNSKNAYDQYNQDVVNPPTPNPAYTNTKQTFTYGDFQMLLDEFCKAYFNQNSDGRKYEGNLSVTDVFTLDENTYKVEGRFTYKKRIKGSITGITVNTTSTTNDFNAIVIDKGDNTYMITFNWDNNTLGDIYFENELNKRVQ